MDSVCRVLRMARKIVGISRSLLARIQALRQCSYVRSIYIYIYIYQGIYIYICHGSFVLTNRNPTPLEPSSSMSYSFLLLLLLFLFSLFFSLSSSRPSLDHPVSCASEQPISLEVPPKHDH